VGNGEFVFASSVSNNLRATVDLRANDRRLLAFARKQRTNEGEAERELAFCGETKAR